MSCAASPRVSYGHGSNGRGRCSDVAATATPTCAPAHDNTFAARLQSRIAVEEAVLHALASKLARLRQQQQQQQQRPQSSTPRGRPAKYEHTLLQCAKTRLRSTLHADAWQQLIATAQPSPSLRRVCELVSVLLSCSDDNRSRSTAAVAALSTSTPTAYAWSRVQALVAAHDVMQAVDNLDAHMLPRRVVEYAHAQLRDVGAGGTVAVTARTREARCVAAWHKWAAALVAFQRARYGALDDSSSTSSNDDKTNGTKRNGHTAGASRHDLDDNDHDDGSGAAVAAAMELCAARIVKATQRKEQLQQQLQAALASSTRLTTNVRLSNNNNNTMTNSSDDVDGATRERDAARRGARASVSAHETTSAAATARAARHAVTHSRRGSSDDDHNNNKSVAVEDSAMYTLVDKSSSSATCGTSTSTTAATTTTTTASATSFATAAHTALERLASESHTAEVTIVTTAAPAAVAAAPCTHCQATQHELAQLRHVNAQLHAALAVRTRDADAPRNADEHVTRQLCELRGDMSAMCSAHAALLREYDDATRERDDIVRLCHELLQRLARGDVLLSEAKKSAAMARQEALLCKAVVCVLRAQNEALLRRAQP